MTITFVFIVKPQSLPGGNDHNTYQGHIFFTVLVPGFCSFFIKGVSMKRRNSLKKSVDISLVIMYENKTENLKLLQHVCLPISRKHLIEFSMQSSGPQ